MLGCAQAERGLHGREPDEGDHTLHVPLEERRLHPLARPSQDARRLAQCSLKKASR